MTTREAGRSVNVGQVGGVHRTLAVLVAAIVAMSCSGDSPTADENLGELSQALSTNDSILGFEGPVGGFSDDWIAGSGTVASSSNTRFSGAHALSLSGNGNASALSAKLTTLGPIASVAKIQVSLPSSLQGQGWLGQIALSFNSPTAGVYNEHAGATVFSGPVGQYRQYAIAIPGGVVTALSTKSYSDLTITVQLNVPSTSGAFLIDELNLGIVSDAGVDASADADASQGAGGSTGIGGGSGTSGAQGAGGAGGQTTGSGTSAGGGGSADANAGAAGAQGSAGSNSGSGGSAGAAGNGGSSGTSSGLGTTVNFFFELPNGVHREDIVFGTTGGDLNVDDGVKLLGGPGFSSVSSVDGGKVNRIGVAGQLLSVWSDGNVTLANNALVHGSMTTSGTVSEQAGAVVTGATIEHATLGPLQTIAWSVLFPSQTLGSAGLEPDQVRAIAPGAYGDTDVKSRAHLKLSPGRYTFDGGFTLEPSAVLEVDNPSAVEIYSRTGFTFRGSIQATQTRANILIGTAATGAVPIDSPLKGAILVAPFGDVALATTSAGHALSVFAHSITAHQNTSITQAPFSGRDFCSEGLDEPGCPSHCTDGVRDGSETDTDCGGDCPACQPGHLCSSDSDCGGGLMCGTHNGACFGAARAVSVCWKPECVSDNQAAGCGQADSACGTNCACVTSCDSTNANSVCPSGEVCRKRMGALFNAPFADACVDGDRCPSNDPAFCGAADSLCGARCVCTPNCSAATCANPSDGCGGTCPGACKAGETGCSDDADCPVDYVCIQSADGIRTCRPSSCAFRILAPPLCGAPGALCGDQCPACTPQCDGRSCGPDPNCGKSCGTCSSGSFCGTNGQCITPAAEQPIMVPDGKGGQRPLGDLNEPPPSHVGALKGAFSVSEQGTAEYSVPIEVPPGRAGMEPNLTLRYSGSRVNEDAGVGWRLEGLSQVTRCPRAHALDGYTSPIQNDPSDHFCIDGKRLETVKGVSGSAPGAYGASGTEYRTLVDSFARVVSYQDSGSGIQLDPATGISLIPRAVQGPDYFRVWTKDGRILTFGRTRDSLVLSPSGVRYTWLLSRVEDHFGNTINVTYTNLAANVPSPLVDRFPNVVRPSAISYTGHVATAAPEQPGNRVVRFTYESRNDPQLRLRQGGVPFIAEQRLARITTYVNSAPVKNYHLQYGDKPLSQIARIFECTGDGDAHCKLPTEFEYQEESGYDFQFAQGLDIDAAGQLDLNGDGIPDFLLTQFHIGAVDADPTLQAFEVGSDVVVGVAGSFTGVAGGIAINAAWGLIKGPFWGLFADDPPVTIVHTIEIGDPTNPNFPWKEVKNAQGVPCEASNPTFLLDYDRDGKDDVVVACDKNAQSFHVARSRGDGNFDGGDSPSFGVTIQSIQSLTPRGALAQQPPAAPIMLDVDGDALQDIVYCQDQYTLAVRRRLAPDQGFGSAVIDTTPPAQTPTKSNPFPPPRTNHAFCGQSRPTYRPFDIDGDGVPDLLFRGSAGWQVLRYSLQSGTPKIEFHSVAFTDVGGSKDGNQGGFAGEQPLSLGDFNGDGLLDVWSSNGSQGIIWLNLGDGRFARKQLFHPRPALDANSGYRLRSNVQVDFNAIGRDSVLEAWSLDNPNLLLSNFNAALVPNSLLTTLAAQIPNLRFPEGTGNDTIVGTFGMAADINGDGVADLFGNKEGVFYGKGAHNTLLSRVVDGVGNLIKITYDTPATSTQLSGTIPGTYSTDGRCGTTPGSAWPDKCLTHINGLVATHSEGFVNAGGTDVEERKFTYHYTNARMNLTGHGWLGFDQRVVSRSAATSSEGGHTVTTDYEPVARYDANGNLATDLTKPYLYPLAGLPKVVTIDALVNLQGEVPPLQTGLLSRRTRIENQWSVQQSAFGRPFPFAHSRTTSTFDKAPPPVHIPPLPDTDNGTLLTECSDALTPDPYGNVGIDEERCQEEGQSFAERTLTLSSFERDLPNWLISNPMSVSVQSQRGTEAQVQQWSLTYSNGMLATVTRAPNDTDKQRHKTTYQRDDFGNPRQILEEVSSGESARTTTVTYDPDNVNPATITNALDQMSQIRFDRRWGTPTTVADPNGIAIQRGYDDFGRLVETRGPEGNTTVTYATSATRSVDTAVGHIEPRVDVTVEKQGTEGTRAGSIVSEYDNYGRLVRNRSQGFGGIDVIEDRAYDPLSRLLGTTLPHTADANPVPTDVYTYDHLSRITRVAHSDATHTSKEFQYASLNGLAPEFIRWLQGMTSTCSGQPSLCVGVMQSIDEEGKKNVVITDYRGLVIRSIDGDNVDSVEHFSTYRYGAFNRLTLAIDNSRNVTSFSYDDYGRRIGVADPDSGPSVFTFNGYDELKTSSDPKKQLRTYSYDDLGRMKNIVDPAGTTQWTYDQGTNAIGRLSESISPATDQNPDGQHIKYTYEPPSVTVNRGLVQKIDHILDGTSYPVALDYDDLARTQRIHYPTIGTGAPVVAQYGYDGSGILTDVAEVGGGATKPIWHLDEAFQAHRIQKETFGNGASTTYGYNADRRWLESIKTSFTPFVSQNIQSLDYTHFGNGQIKTRKTDDLRGSPVTREYQYDNLNRLSYTLDTTETQQQGIATPYTYDAIGNITGRGATVSVYRDGQPHLVDRIDENNYSYDGNGNVSSRAGPDVPGTFQFLDYTPFDLPKAITTGSGTTQKVTRLEYSADEERFVRRDTDTTRYFVDDLYERVVTNATGETADERFRVYAGSRQIAEIRRGASDETLFFHADAIGTVDTISTDTPSFVHQEFDPFGKPIDSDTAITRSGFTGHEHDDDLGLIDMKGRVYDTLAGRFATADPVMQAPYWSQGLNRYSYVFNDPVNNVDPSGFFGESFGDTYAGMNERLRLGYGGSGAAFSVVGSVLGTISSISQTLSAGFPGTGSAARTITAPAPTAAPAASGQGQGSMQATAQTRGLSTGIPTALQQPGTGVGPLVRKHFTTGPIRTKLRATDIIDDIRNDINKYSKDYLIPGSFVDTPFNCISGPDCSKISTGNIYQIDGPFKANPYVQTTKVTPNEFQFTTMTGHPEAGVVTFSASDTPNGPVFNIDVLGHPSNQSNYILYNYLGGSGVQNQIWSNFATNVKGFAMMVPP